MKSKIIKLENNQIFLNQNKSELNQTIIIKSEAVARYAYLLLTYMHYE